MKNPSILIVEDNAVIALLLQEFLIKNGYEIMVPVASGEDAIDYLKKFSPPDLILMDITLDGNIDGIEAARQIREISDVPVIFLSAHPDKNQLLGEGEVTHSGYITKPFFLSDVLALIGRTLHQQLRK
jgi:CheY-like chemotaxis protein